MSVLKKIYEQRESLFLFCISLSIASLPFPFRINSLCIVLLVVAWAIKDSPSDKWRNAQKPVLLLFMSFYLVHVLGIIWTSNTSYGWFQLEKKSFLAVFPLILGTIKPLTKEQCDKILKNFVLGCVTAAVCCLIYAGYRTITTGEFYETNSTTHYTTYYFFYYGLSDIFIHPVYFASYLAFCFLIVLKNLRDKWQQIPSRRRLQFISLLLFLFVFLLMLSARIMIIALVLLLMLQIFYRFFQKGRAWLGFSIVILFMMLVVAVIAITPVLRTRFAELVTTSYQFKNDPQKNASLGGKLDAVNMRLAKWYFTLKAGEDSWLIGQGTGDAQDALMQVYLENNFMEGYIPVYNAHNQYLQTWLMLGILGVLVFFLNIAVPFYYAFTRKEGLCLMFLLLILLFAVTESIFEKQHGVVFYSFFNSLFAFHTLKTSKDFAE
jgi:O-antigen ligase